MDKHMKLRALCHEVATHGPKNWRKGLLEELKAALSVQAGVDGWTLVIRKSELDDRPAVWATDGKSFVWVADLTGERRG